jgi:hypothetical protein
MAIVLSVLQIKVSDYHFDIFKLFFFILVCDLSSFSILVHISAKLQLKFSNLAISSYKINKKKNTTLLKQFQNTTPPEQFQNTTPPEQFQNPTAKS